MSSEYKQTDDKMDMLLSVNSIFQSVNGEVNNTGIGSMTTFVRLAGCNLRCSYCDTTYAQTDENALRPSIKSVVHSVVNFFGSRRVTITGGEPLLQKLPVGVLVNALVMKGINVVIETNGSIAIPVEWPCCFVVDFKLPSSGMVSKMDLDNFNNLNYNDFIKYVIADVDDYNYAKNIEEQLRNRQTAPNTRRAFSPVYGQLAPAELLRWMVADGFTNAYMNLQMHKIIKVR